MSEIRIENVRAGSGSVIAEFDAVLGGVTIIGARLVRGRNGTQFVGLPWRKRADGDEWYEVVVLSESLRSRLRKAADEAFKRGAPSADAALLV